MNKESNTKTCDTCAICVHTYLGAECGLTDNTVDEMQPACEDYIAEDGDER